MDIDMAIKEISGILARLDPDAKARGVIGEWALIYETTELYDDDIGGSWGSIIHARPAIALGMAELFCDSIRADSRGDND